MQRLPQQPPRVAPSAARMANSRRRRDARTSSSVAAFASADDEHERRDARQPVGDAPIDARHVRAAERRQHHRAVRGRPACAAAAAAVAPGASRATIDAIRRYGC